MRSEEDKSSWAFPKRRDIRRTTSSRCSGIFEQWLTQKGSDLNLHIAGSFALGILDTRPRTGAPTDDAPDIDFAPGTQAEFEALGGLTDLLRFYKQHVPAHLAHLPLRQGVPLEWASAPLVATRIATTASRHGPELATRRTRQDTEAPLPESESYPLSD